MRKLPPLPKRVFGLIGPIKVLVVKDLKNPAANDNSVFGLADLGARTISIDADQVFVQQWQTLFHERQHFVLMEAGVQLSHDQAEAVCDATATARVAEMLATGRTEP